MSHSSRTKHGIATARVRGVKWGASGKALAQNNRQMATNFAESHQELIFELMLARHWGPVKLARELNWRCVPARNGGGWHPATVDRLLKRLPGLKEELAKARKAKHREIHSKLQAGCSGAN